MLATIQFDDHSRLKADEVADVDPQGVLSPELEAVQLTAAQATPKKPFRLRQVFAQFPGKVNHADR